MNKEERANLNIFERMARITAEIGVVAKELSVSDGQDNAYKAVSERSILEAVKPLEEKYGVYSYPASRSDKQYPFEREFADAKNPGQMRKVPFLHITVTTTYRFCNIDKPEEYIEITSFGEGYDRRGMDDKLYGKAMTYSDKYALIKAYKIPTGDANDPDSQSQHDFPDDGFYFASPSGEIKVPSAAPNNPMDFSGGAATVVPEPQQHAARKSDKMSLEEAQAFIVTMEGQYKGKSLGEIWTLGEKMMIQGWTQPRFAKNHPEQKALIEAATAFLGYMAK